MSHEIHPTFEISQQFVLQPLQHLQVMTESIGDPVKRERAARSGGESCSGR